MTSTTTEDRLSAASAYDMNGPQPLLLANARIITLDPLIGNFDRGDVLLGGTRIVGIGPGLLTAAGDDNMLVIDCEGLTIAPAVVDSTFLSGRRTVRSPLSGGLAPGNSATFVVLEAPLTDSPEELMHRVLNPAVSPDLLVIDGRVASSAPTPVVVADDAPAAIDPASPFLGTWVDESDFVHQHLTIDGRYDEARGGREHAYQGAYWVLGDRIDYLDDLGFWAYGELVDGVLQHAGYNFHRA